MVARPGVVIHRLARFDERVAWNLCPPRLRYEEAVWDVAAGHTREVDAVAVPARAVGERRTTVPRLRSVLDQRGRMRRRDWFGRILTDIESGTWSVLEHGYLDRVERPHGLPPGLRQVRQRGAQGSIYRDVVVPGLAVVELDGWRHHGSSHQRDRDLDRDLDVAATGGHSLRLGFGQVFDRPCRTAARLALAFRALGWSGQPRPCGPDCDLSA